MKAKSMTKSMKESRRSMKEPREKNLGYLPNSDVGSTSQRLGLSKTGDWGYFGLSVSDTESLFGVPFHGDSHEGMMAR